MRISDWSSDVCSSDLGGTATALPSVRTADIQARRARSGRAATAAPPGSRPCRSGSPLQGVSPDRRRSEEHTSELQSLMRTSYAVFCLKKKKSHTSKNTTHNYLKHRPWTYNKTQYRT